jgi:putative peptidoglycan lipid II flippase
LQSPQEPAPARARIGFPQRVRSLIVAALPRGAVVLSVLALANIAMSLLRLKVLGWTYGAGADYDAFVAALKPGEVALDILVAGGLLAPFVPLFIDLRDKDLEDARAFARSILTLAVAVMAVMAVVLFACAPLVAQFVVPGYSGDQRDEFINLFRLTCATPVIFAAIIVLGEILVAERRFLMFGLAPLMYSGGIIAGAVLLSDRMGIYGAAVGAVVGAVAYLGVRLIGIYQTTFRPRPTLTFRVKGMGEFIRLMLPKMISQPLDPLVQIYFIALASTLVAGSITVMTWANEFQSVPVSLIGIQFSLAAFPALSLAASEGNRAAFIRIFKTNAVTIALLTTAIAVAMFTVGGFFIRIFFGGGKLDDQAISQLTLVMTVFTFSIPIESLMYLMARAIYATKNTILPTIAALAGFTVTIVSAKLMAPTFGLAAIPAGYSIGMAVRLAILVVALAPRMAHIGAPRPKPPTRGSALTPNSRPGQSRRSLKPAQAAAILAVILLAGGSVFALAQAIPYVSVNADPVVTPWARAVPGRSFATPPLIAAAQTKAPTSTTSWVPFGTTGPSPTPAPTYSPGPFSMDLYQKGDFVGEYTDTWCVPAAMQTSINIMSTIPDTTQATQTRLYDLAASLGLHTYGGADPVGWAEGLAQLGYGNYEVQTGPTIEAVIHIVAKQIRLTNRPAGLVVWYGWHSWVVSGFSATADPAYTDNYNVTAVRIEDVWYPRHSNLWNQTRGGISRPPDSNVPVGDLSQDFKKWHQAHVIASREGLFVYVLPVD